MTIQLTDPAVDEFDPDPAIQEWLKDSKRKRRPGFVDVGPKFKKNNNKEHSRSAEEQVIGPEEDTEETHMMKRMKIRKSIGCNPKLCNRL